MTNNEAEDVFAAALRAAIAEHGDIFPGPTVQKFAHEAWEKMVNKIRAKADAPPGVLETEGPEFCKYLLLREVLLWKEVKKKL
jgi:hypothetical protein